MSTSNGGMFTPMPHLADQFDIDRYVQRAYEKLTRQFMDFALTARYPLRCWRTYAALLLESRGRPSFTTGIPRIVLLSCQCRRSTIRAIKDLHRDGWIERIKRPRAGFLDDTNRYVLPHLVR